MKNYTICDDCGQYVPWLAKHEDGPLTWPRDYLIPPHFTDDGVTICSQEGQTPTGEKCNLPEDVLPAIIFKKYRQLALSNGERSPMPPPNITSGARQT